MSKNKKAAVIPVVVFLGMFIIFNKSLFSLIVFDYSASRRLGSARATTYLFVNYLLTLEENNRKVDEKLVANIRRESLSLARSALLKMIQAVPSVASSTNQSIVVR
jgi:hypothetical protein